MSDARSFRFGLAVTGGVSSREEWIGLARRAEDLGYATLLVADHYVNEYPPIAVLMAAADATSTLWVGSYVFNALPHGKSFFVRSKPLFSSNSKRVCPPRPQRRSSALEREKHMAFVREKEEDVA